MKTPIKQTAHRLAAVLSLAFATTGAWADLYWVAQDGTGTWGGNNWSSSASGTGGAWASGTTALFAQSPNNIDLNGESPSIYTLRPAGSGYSASNRRVVNIYNTSETDSTFTYKITGHGNTDFKNLVVTFGGERSTGKVNVYNSKNNNSTTGTHSLKLAWDSHVVFAANSEYTEAGTTDDMIGNNNAASNSLTVAGGKVTINGRLRLGYYGNGSTGVVQIDDGEMCVTGGDIIVGETANNTGAVVLNGGVLTAKCLKGGAGTRSFVFNGGKLVAGAVSDDGLIASSLPVTVNAGGGTIDNGGNAIAIGAAFSGPGAMTFTGTGTTTLSGARTVLDSEYVVDGGTLYFPEDTYIGESGGTPATFTVNGGTLEIDGGKWLRVYKKGVINLNGGTFKTKHIEPQSGAVVNFNGGTLQANGLDTNNGGLIKAGATVNVNGGTIDSGNLAISIGAALGGTGGLTFTGGNTITLNGAVNYSGATFVTPGTILAIANSTAKTNILGTHGLVVVGVPEAGQTIVTYTSALTASDYAKVSCSLAPTTTYKIGEDGKSIVVDEVGPVLDNYWTGAANDGDLSNDANWKAGVPTTGEALIYCTTNSTLTKGASFAPSSITFLAGSAPVKVNGDFSDITQIANNSSSMVEFTGAVAFGGNVDVVQNTGAVKFTGGATGMQLARATDIHGTYTFTMTGDLTEIAGTVVKSDGVYNLLNGTFYKHNADFHVEAGGKAVVKNAKISSTSSKTLLGTFNGLFVVTNQFVVSGNNTHNMRSSGSGTFIVNELCVNQNGKVVPAGKTIMGPDGIIRGAGYVRVLDNGSHEFGSYADWTMYYNSKGANTATGEPVFYKHSSSTSSHLTFDTTDYYDSSIGRTITCEAPICAVNADSAAKFDVTVKGKGKFVFANTSDGNIFSGGLTVQDTATVEVKANAKPGKGAIKLGAGTTLALTSTSNEFTPLANTLNLPTGENEVATIRIDGTRLKSGVDHEIATVGTGATANVALDPASAALAGRKATLAVEDGNLVLNIQPDGLMVIFR